MGTWVLINGIWYKAAISVSGKDKLAEVFEALIEAVRKGELDEQIKAVQSAAKASRKAA
jgi:hypothetical protein